MSTATDIRGLKRVCTGCGTRFYDMNKRPIVCPSCGTEFSGDFKVKGRRSKAAADKPKVETSANDEGQVSDATAAKDTDEDDLDDDEDAGVEMVSLDDDSAISDAGADDEETHVDLGAIEGGDLDDIEDTEDDNNDLPDPDADIIDE